MMETSIKNIQFFVKMILFQIKTSLFWMKMSQNSIKKLSLSVFWIPAYAGNTLLFLVKAGNQ